VCAKQAKFNKVRGVCAAADQGLRALLERLVLALEEVPPAALAALHGVVAQPAAAAAAAASGASSLVP
jgi:hypothetical protein